MGWLIALGVLVILACLPLGAQARYDEHGPRVRVIAGPVRLTVYPRPKKKPKKQKAPEAIPPKEQPKPPPAPTKPEPAQAAEPPKPALPKAEPPKAEKTNPPKQEAPAPQPTQSEPTKGGSLKDFLPLVRLGLDLLGDFRRKLRVNRLDLKLTLAGEDPCDLAVNYGRAWAAVGNLIPQLERLFVIKKRDVEVQCDFTSSEIKVYARLDLTITLGRLLALAVVYGIRALKEFLSIRKKRKGGAVK